MTVSELRSPVVADEPMRPPLLPEHPRRMGPVTRALVLRTVAVIAAVQVLGAVLVVVGGRWRAAGLSLAFPGGGFLYTAAPLAFALTWVALTVALVLWWGVSLHVGNPGALVRVTRIRGGSRTRALLHSIRPGTFHTRRRS